VEFSRGGHSPYSRYVRATFISPRTGQYYLAKVFQKLEMTSRGQFHRVLPG
jgi:hypothetical protein